MQKDRKFSGMIFADTPPSWHHSTITAHAKSSRSGRFGDRRCAGYGCRIEMRWRRCIGLHCGHWGMGCPLSWSGTELGMWRPRRRWPKPWRGDTMPGDPHVLLAPMESNVIPLPHQLNVLARTMAGDRVRYLLADEVGLGKTIEAGLVMRELKLRGRVRRTLVVAPKGLAPLSGWRRWRPTFNEPFQLVLGEDIGTLQRLALAGGKQHRSPWTMFDQVIVVPGLGEAHGEAAGMVSRAD